MEWVNKGCSVESYVSSCLSLLNKWSWLFKERPTEILKAEILDKPPASDVLHLLQELDHKALKEVPNGFTIENWPSELKDFINMCHALKLNMRLEKHSIHNIDASLFKKMKPKKREEVTQLAAIVAKECVKYDIHHVVDIGSGLGYVDRVLNQVFGLNVLGLEKDGEKVSTAEDMGGNIKYEKSFISEETFHGVRKQIADWLQGCPACIIALHACGDLSVLIGRLFAEIEEAKTLILIPCCYHLSKFRPLSKEVQSTCVINTNLLRLASDATSERWSNNSEDQLTSHARSVLARALIEKFASEGNVQIKKKNRRLFRSEARSDWNKCLESCLERTSGLDRDKINHTWKSNECRINQMKAFSCLQVCLQGVAEGLVFADMFLFFTKILPNSDIRLIRIFDVLNSPRSISFIINK